MTRIDRARLQEGVFPHRCEIATRYSDLDQLGHVNNVAAAEILQEARARFVAAADLTWGNPRPQVVVASSLIEFVSDLTSPEPVEVSTALLEIGRTSFRLGQVARQGRGIGLYAEIVQVVRDAQGPMPIPDDWRTKLESLRLTSSHA
jgi:acyl-CoA thioester hydrolase